MAAGVRKAADERHYLSKAKGGGVLRRAVWADGRGRVVRYNLAYINPLMHPGDNGRVLGYDSTHGQHHRHLRGKITAVSFGSFGEIEMRFAREWSRLIKEGKDAKD
jgi:hypothetical protein